MIPDIVEGWKDIQANPRHLAHGSKVINGVAHYNKDAANLVKYLGEFIGMSCAPDMLALRLFPNAKEISESFGAYDAVRYRLQEFKLNDPSVTVIAVGDGNTPRTAATFAFRSKWTCFSVDPNLKGGTLRWSAVKRLHVLPQRIEDVHIEADQAIIVAVHSHAKLPAAVASVKANRLAVVSIPCCQPQRLELEPDIQYQDKHIISPERTVKIWRNVAC
jgi:hypothetical protein